MVRGAFIAVLVAFTGGLAALAPANPGYETKLTIGVEFDGSRYIWSGKTKSEKGGCEKGRLVKLFNDGEEGALSSDTTNGRGEWRIVQQTDTLTGDYYARVKRKVTDAFVCKSDRSRKVELPTR